jgi:hypothetical protein
MTTTYVFTLNENKYFVTEFKNEVIETIEQMIKKLIPDGNPYDSNDLLIQNLGKTISSLEWIKKYPIEKITKTNYNLERIFFNYVKNYGIDNVRSDVYKDIELSEANINYIQTILDDSKEPIPIRISLIDIEINKFKKIYDDIVKNNIVINKYTNYSTHFIITKFQQLIQQENQINQQKIQDLNNKGKHQESQIEQQKNNMKQHEKHQHFQKYHNQLSNKLINTLERCFIEDFIKDYNINDVEIKNIIEKYFSDHKLVEEIANALLLKKQNEKLIAKYGSLEVINKKLSEMLYKKIDLLHQIDLDDVVNNHKVNYKDDYKTDVKDIIDYEDE